MRFSSKVTDAVISTMFIVGGLALIFLGKLVNMDIFGFCGNILCFFGILYFFNTVLDIKDIFIYV